MATDEDVIVDDEALVGLAGASKSVQNNKDVLCNGQSWAQTLKWMLKKKKKKKKVE